MKVRSHGRPDSAVRGGDARTRDVLDGMPVFKRRMEWFIEHRPDLTANLACMRTPGDGERRLLVDRRPAISCAAFSSHARRDASSCRPTAFARSRDPSRANPYVLNVGGAEHRVDYEPAESRTGLFGGNSNWRGPIWFPVNYLLVEALQKFHHYLGDDVQGGVSHRLGPVC